MDPQNIIERLLSGETVVIYRHGKKYTLTSTVESPSSTDDSGLTIDEQVAVLEAVYDIQENYL